MLATGGALVATTLLFALGLGHRAGKTQLLERASTFAGRVGGLPPWVALPSAIGTASLITALLGMYWDISLHIDQGRDAGPLANPAHYLILFGLFGIFAAGFLSMCIPKEKPGPTAIRLFEGWYAPLGGVLMAAAGGFALIGFPLDDVWHRLFGQDVTLWGPTHLMLIGGASISLIGQGILLAEGTRSRPGGRERGAAAAPRLAGRRLPDRPVDVPGRVRLRRAAVRLPLPADADRARREHRPRLGAHLGRPRRGARRRRVLRDRARLRVADGRRRVGARASRTSRSTSPRRCSSRAPRSCWSSAARSRSAPSPAC